MDWQIILVLALVAVSAVGLFIRFYKIIKKPHSICNTCLMKDSCGMNCDDL